jgi:hypothetical protein
MKECVEICETESEKAREFFHLRKVNSRLPILSAIFASPAAFACTSSSTVHSNLYLKAARLRGPLLCI